MVNCYAGYTESERRGTSPLPPSKGGKSESEGGMLSLQRGNAVRSAISKQRVVCRVGANLSVRPFFVWCRQYPNANFANGRKSTQTTVFVILPPTLCHSERSEESREEERGDSSLRSE